MKKVFSLAILIFTYQFGTAQKHYGAALPSDYQPSSRDTLTLVTWNVEHFIDQFDNPYIRNQREDKADSAKVWQRAEKFATVLRALNADVVVLQEFESQPLIESIAKRYLEDMGYVFFAAVPSPDWYMNVVFMSKVPLGTVHGYGAVYTPVEGSLDREGRPETQKNINTRMVSVEVLPRPDYSLIIHGLHLKAGRNERDEAMRKGQINFLLGQCVRFQREDRRVRQAVMGDLNCIQGSKEFESLLAGKKKVKFIDPFEGKSVFSHPSENPQRQLDHILPNKQLHKALIKTEVFQHPLCTDISDHLPVRAFFLIKK